MPPSRIDLVGEEVDKSEGRNGPEPPIQRSQDEQLHPADRPGLEHVPADALDLPIAQRSSMMLSLMITNVNSLKISTLWLVV